MCAGKKGFEEALNAAKFLGCQKKFGPAQNILGPVKGQGITLNRRLWTFILFQDFFQSACLIWDNLLLLKFPFTFIYVCSNLLHNFHLKYLDINKLPKNSPTLMSVNDFPTVSALAEYLIYLTQNPVSWKSLDFWS